MLMYLKKIRQCIMAGFHTSQEPGPPNEYIFTMVTDVFSIMTAFFFLHTKICVSSHGSS